MDLISRKAARARAVEIRLFDRHVRMVAVSELEALPSAQPEQSDTSEFWRKRADFYSDMCMNLIGEMGRGVKIESVKISENGIEFIKEQPPTQPDRSLWFRIGEICVDESKGFISQGRAVEKIRELLREAERREE